MNLQSNLLNWYRKNKRELPWRRRVNLYRTLVSEFMLQQTRVNQAVPYYLGFLKAFPTFKSLARAKLEKIMKRWEGLGYYRRAGHLHETAKLLAGKKIISSESIKDCPGIGPYMFAAVSSIVWNEPHAVVDGNVIRVIARFLALPDKVESTKAKARIQATASDWLYRKSSGEWNQAMMELGATICTPKNPNCLCCPIRTGCCAYKLGSQELFPKKKRKPKRPHREMAAAIIRKNGHVLITKRPAFGLLSNLWEFPNVECKRGEHFKSTLSRSLFERAGMKVDVGAKVGEVDHAFTHFSMTLHSFDCRLLKETAMPEGKRFWKWVRCEHLRNLPFPRAHWPMVEKLTGLPQKEDKTNPRKLTK